VIPRLDPPELRRPVAGEEGANGCVGIAPDLGYAPELGVTREHDPVDGYPQQLSHEVMGGEQRIIQPQEPALCEPLEAACQRGHSSRGVGKDRHTAYP
jgi:hypothetical protein